MRHTHYIYIGLATLAMASCGDFNDKLDGYCEDDYKPKDVKSIKYELTSSDYAMLSTLSGDNNIKANQYFSSADDAHTYIPQWLAYTYPTADDGSSVTVTYWQKGGASHYLAPLGKATTYTMVAGDDASDMDALLKRVKPEAAKDDIVLVSPGGDGAMAAYQYSGSAWRTFTNTTTDITVLPQSVYNSLGSTFVEDAGSVIPTFLKTTYPYASNDNTKTVIYYYNKYKVIGARQYTLEGGEWTLTALSEKVVTEKTSAPFVLTNGAWTYDPSVTITLPYVKQDPTSKVFYQAATDWVWDNIDTPAGVAKGQGYVSKWGNNDYYTGSSAYNSCVDWTPKNAKAQNAAAFEGKADEEIIAFMQQNLTKVWAEVLKTQYPDARPVDGIEVIYTVNFTATMPNAVAYTIQYKVTGNAEFTYVEGSMKQK